MFSFLSVFAILRGSSCSDVTLPVSALQECSSHLLHLKLDDRMSVTNYEQEIS